MARPWGSFNDKNIWTVIINQSYRLNCPSLIHSFIYKTESKLHHLRKSASVNRTASHADVCIWFCFREFTKDWKNLTSWFHQSFIGLGQDTSHFSRITSKGCRVSKTVHLPCRNKQIGIGDQHVWNAPTLRLKDIGTSAAPLIFQLLIQLSWVYLEL